MKLKPLDVFLVLTVSTSVAVIGYRFVNNRNTTGAQDVLVAPGNQVGDAIIQAPVLPVTTVKTETKYGRSQAFILEVMPPQSFAYSPILKKFRRPEAASCAAAKTEDLSAAAVFIPEVAAKLEAETLRYYFDTGSPCLRTGQTITFYILNEEPEKPYMSLIAEAKVSDLIQIPKTDIGPAVAGALGVAPQSLTSVFNMGRLQKVGIMTLVELSSVRKLPPLLSKPIPSFPRVMTLSPRTVTNWFAGRKNVLIVDARSKAEAEQSPIKTAIPGSTVVQLNYGKQSGPMPFNGKRTLKEYNTDPVELTELSTAIKNYQERSEPWHLLVISTDASDARAIGTLLATQELTSSAALRAWYYDGVASFNLSVGK